VSFDSAWTIISVFMIRTTKAINDVDALSLAAPY
jgi:hypothetical protein